MNHGSAGEPSAGFAPTCANAAIMIMIRVCRQCDRVMTLISCVLFLLKFPDALAATPVLVHKQ